VLPVTLFLGFADACAFTKFEAGSQESQTVIKATMLEIRGRTLSLQCTWVVLINVAKPLLSQWTGQRAPSVELRVHMGSAC